VRWESPTLHIEQSADSAVVTLAPGKHRITAVSASTGEAVSSEVEVRTPQMNAEQRLLPNARGSRS
jgi:hypothetical protein